MAKPPDEDPSQKCAAGTLRRATRSVARLYDSRLARAGLTTTQFSILRLLERHPHAVPLSQLAEEQVFERSSLYRALEPLRREGLVKLGGEDGRRAKDVALTARGRQRIARALPHWREAQDEFLAQFGRSAWSSLSAQLGDIVEAARVTGSSRRMPKRKSAAMSSKARLIALLGAAVVGTTHVARAQQSSADRMIGTWQGVLASGAFRQRLAFVVSRDSTGALRGALKSLDQGNVEAPAVVAVRGDTLSFTIATEHVSYSGVMAASGDSLRGTIVQGGSFPLAFGRSTGAPAIATRPQDPKPPYPYRTEEVTVPSESGVRLAGTVVIPEGRGPFPAVVFVTGSGPQDRDETLMGHRPFLVIADYLARHGIASLRYDDRGFAKSTGKFGTATSADFAVDAEAALHFLQRVPGIARDRVGILGHSEGGLIGPMIAARTRDVAFLVLMAGPGMAGDSLSLLQLRRLTQTTGMPTAQIDAMVDNNRRIFRAVAGARDSADVVARVTVVKQEIVAALPEDQRAAAASRFDRSLPQLVAPWMRYFLTYDPRVALRNVHVPVLALGGTLDLQVPARENLSGIDSALKAAGNTDYRVVELPNLNHLFQTATTGAPAEYANIEETVAPQALELITSWINQRFGRGERR